MKKLETFQCLYMFSIVDTKTTPQDKSTPFFVEPIHSFCFQTSYLQMKGFFIEYLLA